MGWDGTVANEPGFVFTVRRGRDGIESCGTIPVRPLVTGLEGPFRPVSPRHMPQFLSPPSSGIQAMPSCRPVKGAETQLSFR